MQGGGDKIDHRGGYAGCAAILLLLNDGCEIILCYKGLAHFFIGRHDTRAGDGPIMIEPHVEQLIEIDCKVGPVKVANANVHDAGLEF
jgi:hypothetical protein